MDDWAPPASIEELIAQGSTEGNKFSGINSPVAGARTPDPLPAGAAPFQLYSLATPNGQKVGILLEELGLEYDAHVSNIGRGDQFSAGFVALNPNSKIPCALDKQTGVRLFESGAIALYLADKHKRFIPSDPGLRAECINWIMWQTSGQGPMSGNFGHFFVYAPGGAGQARSYGAERYGMEVQRLCSVLDQHLAGKQFICGDMYTIADMMCLPWFDQIRNPKGYLHPNGVGAKQFLSPHRYTHLNAWADRLLQRPQVQRGMLVCRKYGKPWMHDHRFKHLAKL
eukprot:TRINITY_DN7304_c0_g2_i2.p1 TRINITY_DN7304_c0_g2~~TRINITY_DN7304_c0_g2_i2.p1  ORF type:complete len:283 (-),score=64.01 TRINITY_DN7304_c0_g2_i2:118-966(-)